MAEMFSFLVHAFEMMLMLAMGELQSERVDEAIRATDVMAASMIRVRHNAAIPSIWNVRWVVLHGLAEVQIRSDMLAMRAKFRALMLTVVAPAT